ncbi:hypothetical protein N9137_00855 [Pseudomonadales bacterium]|nr:hypothetical protein [Pseudomonadales bacterium]
MEYVINNLDRLSLDDLRSLALEIPHYIKQRESYVENFEATFNSEMIECGHYHRKCYSQSRLDVTVALLLKMNKRFSYAFMPPHGNSGNYHSILVKPENTGEYGNDNLPECVSVESTGHAIHLIELSQGNYSYTD